MNFTTNNFFEALFKYDFLMRSLFTCLIVGIVCGIVGVIIILKKFVFMGAGIAHASFAGGALGILLNINPFFSIFLFGGGSALSIGFINEKGYMEDNNVAVGVIFSLTMALGVLFVTLNPTYNVAVNALLFGNVLTVTTEDFVMLLLFAILIIVIIYFTKKEMFFTTFDEEMAKSTGIPVRFLNYLFLLLISLAIVVSIKAIGALLVFAMIVTPAAAAYQWSYKFNTIIYLSVVFGMISSFLGLYFSYALDLPSGSCITITVSVIFVVSILFSPKRRAGKSIGFQHIESCEVCAKADINTECHYCSEQDRKHF
ncbi:MAG: metal ABC transporter permease [Candidatus Lokiarchaeota archaeon]|nr:metal ABC transporter permease [Candidatus Lokiarchaeota archaeon]